MMSALPSPALFARISFGEAVELAARVLEGCGLAATHGIAAIYGAGDFRAEGAAFAVTIQPKAAGTLPAGTGRGGLKVLIQDNGQTSLRPLPQRRARRVGKGAAKGSRAAVRPARCA